jgi:hypothetical protein
VKPEDTLLYFRIDRSLFYFFKRDPNPEIKDFEKLAEHLKAPAPVYCLMQKKTYVGIPDEIKQQLTILEEGLYGNITYYLLVKPVSTIPAPNAP